MNPHLCGWHTLAWGASPMCGIKRYKSPHLCGRHNRWQHNQRHCIVTSYSNRFSSSLKLRRERLPAEFESPVRDERPLAQSEAAPRRNSGKGIDMSMEPEEAKLTRPTEEGRQIATLIHLAGVHVYLRFMRSSLPPTRYARGSDIFAFLPRVSPLRSSLASA